MRLFIMRVACVMFYSRPMLDAVDMLKNGRPLAGFPDWVVGLIAATKIENNTNHGFTRLHNECVKERMPSAYCAQDMAGNWVVWDKTQRRMIGKGSTPGSAWRDAALKLGA